MKNCIIDGEAQEGTHLAFNLTLIKLYSNLIAQAEDKNEILVDEGYKESGTQLANALNSAKVFTMSLSLAKENPYFYLLRLFPKLFCKLVGKERVFVLYASAPLCHLLYTLQKIIGFKLTIFMHGNLSSSCDASALVGGWKRFSFETLFRKLEKDKQSKINIVCLEQYITENILSDFQINHIIKTLPHPVNQIHCKRMPSLTSKKVIISFLGIATVDKGYELFCSMAKNNASRFEFALIGSVHNSFNIDEVPENIINGKNTQKLSYEKYQAMINESDIIFLPLDGRYYNYSASGTLIDSIATRRFIMSSKGGPLSSLSKSFGDIGITYIDETELQNKIEQLMLKSNEEIEQISNTFISNMDRLIQGRTGENIDSHFKECF